MPTIADLRTDYPELGDLDDEQLVGAVHQALYADLPRERVASHFGLKPRPVAPVAAAAPPPSGPMRRAADVALSIGKGVIGVPEAIVGMVDLATGGRAGRAVEQAGVRFKDAKAVLDDYMSPEAKAAQEKFQQSTGVLDAVGTAVTNPSLIVNAAAESLPMMGMGGAIARPLMAAAPRLGALGGAAAGEGIAAAGSGAEQIRQQTPDGLLTPVQSGVAAVSGAATGLLGVLGGKIAQRMGIADVDTLIAGGAGAATTKGFVRRVLEGAAAEGLLEELPQSIQEQVAQNYALGKPLDEGVVQAAVLGALTGGAMGGAVNVFAGKPPAGPMQRAVETVVPPPVPTGEAPLGAPGDQAVAPGDDPLAPGVDPVAEMVPPEAVMPTPDADGAVPPPAAAAGTKPKALPDAEPRESSDILNIRGAPFTTRTGAENRRKAEANPDSLRLARVDTGWVLKPAAQQDAAAPVQADSGSAAPAPVAAAPSEPGADDLKRMGFNPAGPGPGEWVMKVSNLGEVIAKVVSENPLRVEISADYMGKRLGTRVAEGDAAIQEAIDTARNGINAGRQRMAQSTVEGQQGAIPNVPIQPTRTDAQTTPPAAPPAQAPAPAAVPAAEAAGSVPDTGLPAGVPPALETRGVAGEAIDSEWTAFAPETGTKGIPRADMPQVKAEHRGALTQFLKGRGIAHQQEAEVEPGTLKPTQAEFSPAKVRKAREFTGGDRAILVSNDGHVVDGHHQWAAALDDGKPIRVIRLDAPIDELLPVVKEFPSVEAAPGATSPEKPVNLRNGASSANTPTVPPAPQPAGPVTAGARWDVFMPMEREKVLLDAGWKAGSAGTMTLRERTWDQLKVPQRNRLAAAMGLEAAPAVSREAPSVAETAPAVSPTASSVSEKQEVVAPAPKPSAGFDNGQKLAQAMKASKPQPTANTIVTEDAADRARALLRKKLGQVSTGIDPEVLQAGITLAAYHVERGARKFAAYARAMVDDMGDIVKPYLQSWYMAMRSDPAYASLREGMDKASAVEDLNVDQVLGETAPPAPAAAPAPAAEPPADAGLVVMPASEDAFAQALEQAAGPDPETEARIRSDVDEQVNGELERERATFRPSVKPVSLPRTSSANARPAGVEFLTPDQAQAKIDSWKAEADRQGREKAGPNGTRTVISLFDASGVLAQPWYEAGYNVVAYDLQTGADISEFDAQNLLEQHGNDDVWAILAQPPCTDFASSGAQWWKDKDADGRTEASNELVRQVLRTVELFRPPVWVMENPVGRIQKLNQLPDPLLQFDPWHFGDPYTKRTLLWGNFENQLPMAPVEPVDGSKMHRMSSSAKFERSLTSEPFAYALFMANNAEGMPAAQRMARLFPGIEAKLFQAALDAGHSEYDIKSTIEDPYYESQLSLVRDELARLGVPPHRKGPAMVVEQDGKFYVRMGDDRALVGPMKTRKAADKYAASLESQAPDADTAPQEAPTDESNQPGLGEGDSPGGRRPGGERGASAQPADAQDDPGNVAAPQPGDVEAAAGDQPDGAPGDGGAGANVGPAGGTAAGRPARDRRPRAGGTRAPDAGAGDRGGAGQPAVDPGTVSPANAGPGDFVIADPLKVVGGGQVARFDKNKAAIELRNTLIEAGRAPTREEQTVLAGYTGWGSFGQELFQGTWGRPAPKPGWEARDQWLRDNLGEKEWTGLQTSIINAHYTDPPTVLAMWDMVRRMGFTGGRVLEPSIGIGNFYGLMPADLTARSQRAGIELDEVTGSMAQMLYPQANIQIKGYEKSTTPDNFYDLVIGNWPFFEHGPADRRYNRLAPTLHDYFFLKAIDQTRPGGLIVGITTKGTMDKKGAAARMEMARKAELVAAFRLPTGAFEEYAGTKVVTDIIILRKREKPISLVDKEQWIRVEDHDTKEGTKVPVNEYFHRNPSHVIGEIDFGHGTTTFRPGLIVHRPPDMMDQLRRIVGLVPEAVFQPRRAMAKEISYVANHTSDRTNSLTKTPQGFYIVQGEYLAPANEVVKYELKDAAKTAAREAELAALIDMRKLYGALIDAERRGEAEAPRATLRAAYDAFVKASGPLSESFGLGYLRKIDDPFYPALAALEVATDGAKGKRAYRPAAILTESTMRGARKMDAPSIADAFVLARNEAVNPSVERIAELAGEPADKVRTELIKAGAAFELPNGDFSPADLYLSGNVRQKLREAQAALADGNAAMQHNVDELAKVIPADVPYYQIETQMGATWVPARTYADFIAHMLGMDTTEGIEVSFQAGGWKLNFDSSLNHRAEARSGFGSPNVYFKRLVRAAIANQTINVKRKDSDGNEYIDEAATKEVNGKIADMRMKFGEWLWSDPVRRVELEREYNEVRNAYATPKFDGSFLGFQGMALSLGRGPFNLREHQVNAIWRALVTRKSLNAHEVGTGKTFTMGGIAVESRRYGIAKKPMLFAHNANSKSVAHEIQMMYPAAKVLYVDNLGAENLKTRMMQIANDDWDVVVLPHSVIDRIGFKEETLRAMAQDELMELEIAAEEAADEDGVKITQAMLDGDEKELNKLRSPTAKQLVKQRLKIISTIEKLSQQASKEDSVAFEDMGVDMVLVDEAHEFKKPPIATKMRMKGLQTQTSNRSIAMMFLTRYVRSMNNGGGVHLFTGTPITNTMTEVFHMMRYMMQEEMQTASLADWDGWFGSFAREVNDVELNPAGEYEAVTRLQAFINVPELRRMIGQYMDVVFSEDMPEMLPRSVNGKRMGDPTLTEADRRELLDGRTEGAQDRPYKKVINESSDMTPEQLRVFEQVQGYARRWRNMAKKDRKEAMLHGAPESPIIHEGIAARASFDVRLVDAMANAGKEGSPELEPHPDSKPARVVRNLVRLYNEDQRITQVVFMEQGMAKSVTRREGPAGMKRDVTYPAFSTMADMIERLVQAGIPRNEIAAVTGATSKDKRKEIADAMNTGKIRIVFGSSDSLGVGVNMQKNLRAMHHMDAPWMPGELEQRNGRGHRQGNQWNTVLEFRYLTDRLDGRRWQVLAIKQRFITDFMKSKGDVRVIEGDAASDEGGDILSTFSEAAGDPRILLKEKFKKKVEHLQSRERLHTQAQVDARGTVKRLARSIEDDTRKLEKLRKDGSKAKIEALIESQRGDGFRATIDGREFADRAEAAGYLDEWSQENLRKGDDKDIGTYGGITLRAVWPNWASRPDLSLQVAGQRVDANGLSFASLDNRLRNLRDSIEAYVEESIARDRKDMAHAQTVAAEPFHLGKQLADMQKQLRDIEIDIDRNPVAPPFWLRTGAPVDTEVFRRGKPFVVTGHRWSADGWFVLASDAKGETAIPYAEAQDSQGLPLYEERAFEPPGPVQQGAAALNAPSTAPAAPVATDVLVRDESTNLRQTGAPEANTDDVVFSRGAGQAASPAEAHRARIEALATAIAAGWANGPKVVVARNLRDPLIPQRLRDKDQQQRSAGATGEVEGFFTDGTVYLFTDQLGGAKDAVRVMFHEALGHYGLRGTFGPALGPILDRIAVLQAGKVRAKAAAYGLDFDNPRERRQAAEEVLAEMAQAQPELGWVQKAVAAIRTWLREHVPGFATMRVTDDEIIRSYILPARGWVERGRAATAPRGELAVASRAEPMASRSATLGDIRSIDQQAIRNHVADLLGGAGAKVSWWQKTVGTQYAKAQKHPEFGRVFDAVQTYLEDVSTLANRAANEAPAILPKLDNWKDLKRSAAEGLGLKPADVKALAGPVFEGTLGYTRGADGRVMSADDADAAAAAMSAEDKARAMVRAGRLSPDVLRMWQGLPIEQFEAAVETRYRNEMMRTGVVWTDAELRERFQLTDEQIGHYRQFRAAVDRSLDQMVAADVLRLLGDVPPGFKAMAVHAPVQLRAAVEEYLQQLRPDDTQLWNDVADRFNRIDQLKEQGYAPLMRFGKFKVHVTGADGETLFFGLYETAREANRMVRELREDPGFAGASFTQGVLSQEAYKLFSQVPPESLEMFAEALGAERSVVFQEYLRLAKNNRSALKRLIRRKGTAGFSEDAPRVLASFVTSNARLGAAAMNLPGAKAAAEGIRDGDVQDEAVKLIEAVQNPTGPAAAIRGLMFMNFIGGSIASAVVNLTQPITMTLPYLSQFGGLPAATKRLMAAAKVVAAGTGQDTQLAAALARAEADGIVSPQEIHHLQAQAMSTWGTNPLARRAAFIWSAPFSLAEQWNRRVSFIAAYNTARERGDTDAFGFAERAVIETQGLYNTGNAANWARNPAGALALQFKQYSVHYLEWMVRMWKSGPEGKKAVGIALLLLAAAGGSDGLPFAEDIDDLVDTIRQALGYDSNFKRSRREFIAKDLGLGDMVAEVATRGLSALPGIPMDVSLRMGMGNLLPATGLLLRSNTDRSRDVLEIAGPAGGLAKQYSDAATKALEGDLLGGARTALPVALQNAAKAAGMWSTGEARDEKGRRVMEADAVDGFMRFLGFNPANIARESQRMGMIRRSEQLAKNIEGGIVERWARAIVEKDPEAIKAARAALVEWNQTNPSAPIRITIVQVRQRARKMMQDRSERFLKSVSPERRAAATEALQ